MPHEKESWGGSQGGKMIRSLSHGEYKDKIDRKDTLGLSKSIYSIPPL